MKIVSKTDTGKVRTNNEDSILVDAERGIFLLADGMGGHNAGEVASAIAIKEAHSFILNKLDPAQDDENILLILEEALVSAHNAIKERAATDVNLLNMGTTLVEVLVRDGNAYVCHAGDSRAYLFRSTLQRLTRDHTVGDSWVEKGYMTREQVPPQQWHMLTQAVGIGDCPVPDKMTVELKPSDILLLCSDGLTDMLEDVEIAAILKKASFPLVGHPSNERLRIPKHRAQASRSDKSGSRNNVHISNINEIADSLIEGANNKGGRDNISVVIVQYD